MTKVNPICAACRMNKDPGSFYADRKKINGLSTYCKECCRTKAKGSYSRNPDRAKAAMKAWRKNNPERNAFIKAKSAYGITEKEFFNLPKVCVICGARKKLVIDHSHQTGRIRGRLCSLCNTGLGHFKDNQTAIKQIIKLKSRKMSRILIQK